MARLIKAFRPTLGASIAPISPVLFERLELAARARPNPAQTYSGADPFAWHAENVTSSRLRPLLSFKGRVAAASAGAGDGEQIPLVA
jgi:hypothetical protein